MTDITWIIFDLGGVVIEVNPALFFETLSIEEKIPPKILVEKFRRKISNSSDSLFYQHQEGRISSDYFFEKFIKKMELKCSPDFIKQTWESVLLFERNEILDLISKLSTKYKIACLSNTDANHWDYMTKNYKCFGYFEIKGASHLFQASKPKSEIYKRMQNELSGSPDGFLFIDDLEENILSAKEAGWQGIQFTTFEKLCSDLSLLTKESSISMRTLHEDIK